MKWFSAALMALAFGLCVVCVVIGNIPLLLVNIVLFGVDLYMYFTWKNIEENGWKP
jgi:hypothetical protein